MEKGCSVDEELINVNYWITNCNTTKHFKVTLFSLSMHSKVDDNQTLQSDIILTLNAQ